MTGERKKIILEKSNELSKVLGFSFLNKEFNYGLGIGRADNYFERKDKLIIIEVEKSQRHPEMNVLKAWPYLKNETSKSIFLIQYIVDTDCVSPNRINLCKWISKEMKNNLKSRFHYFLIENILSDPDALKHKIDQFIK